jgi:hypothetical protein
MTVVAVTHSHTQEQGVPPLAPPTSAFVTLPPPHRPILEDSHTGRKLFFKVQMHGLHTAAVNHCWMRMHYTVLYLIPTRLSTSYKASELTGL